ncbi:MAG: transposase [Clostridium sp.]|nr:transposase [Clostridium sp.]
MELNQKGNNQLHLNALYDLSNRIYLDALVQPGSHPDEAGALIAMMKRSPIHEKTILIADRGYECYNIFAHAQEKGWNYLIRIKDFGSGGTITNLSLPSLEEFECPVPLILTKKQIKEVKAHAVSDNRDSL